MKNPLVDGPEAEDIKQAVQRLILDIGNPEPPLDLSIVRDRLDLDREYYSSSNPTGMQELVHMLKVGTKQVFKRPLLLVDAIRSLDLRALFFPDTKRILIDRDLHRLKHRWAEGHEIGHSLIWWHHDYLLGDSDSEIDPACHAVIEAEANFACGQLLFLQDKFIEDSMSVEVEFKSVQALYRRYKNTLTSTLWRFVENHKGNTPLVGIVSCHPKHPPIDFDPFNPCRYAVQSPMFRQQFSNVTEPQLFSLIASYCWNHEKRGPLGSAEVSVIDDNGQRHLFYFESFSIGYQVLTLGKHLRKTPASIGLTSAIPVYSPSESPTKQ